MQQCDCNALKEGRQFWFGSEAAGRDEKSHLAGRPGLLMGLLPGFAAMLVERVILAPMTRPVGAGALGRVCVSPSPHFAPLCYH